VSSSGTLAVRLDRRRVNRIWVPVVCVVALLAAAVVAVDVALIAFVSGRASLWVALPVVVPSLGMLLVCWSVWSQWRRLLRVEVPLEVGPGGLVMRSAYGEVRAPWSAVRLVEWERHWSGPRVRFRLVDPRDPRWAGVRSELSGRADRYLRSHGFVYALRTLDVSREELAVAIEAASRTTS
jgi:hypothetical protein